MPPPRIPRLLTHPGIKPRPPSRLPTPNAPFLPNSTATNPKGSSREGISAKSAPLNRYGGRAVNSGFEYTRSGYISIKRASFSAAKRPYKSMTGPTQMSWIDARFSSLKRIYVNHHHGTINSTYSDGMTSAIRSTPFCFDQRPTNTNKSAFGSCLMPAHSWACRFKSGR